MAGAWSMLGKYPITTFFSSLLDPELA